MAKHRTHSIAFKRRLGFGMRRTMQLVQKLYEGVEFGGAA